MGVKSQLVSGVFYTALSKYAGIVITLVVTAVLARLLSPDDFGVVGVASVIIAFFNLFTDMGFSPAIIQYKDLSREELSKIFSFTFFLGLVLAVLFFLSATFISDYYDRPVLEPICRLLSINLFFASINIVPNSLFYRDKNFKYIAVRGFIIQFACGVVAVVVALSGGGLYALVINPIVSAILLFVVSFRRYPQTLRFTLGIGVIRPLFSYSIYQFLFNIICYFSRNIDTLLIGKFMNMSKLGYYDKAYRLMLLPLQNITQVITPVMHPILSDFQENPGRLSEANEKITKILATIGFPLSVFLYFSAKEVTLLFFGDQWMASVPIFQILSLSVGVQVVLSSSGSIFQAAGDTRSLFICGLFSSFLNILGISLGVFYFDSLTAIAGGIVVAFYLSFIQCYWHMYKICLKRQFNPFLRVLIAPFFVSVILVFLFFFFSRLNIGMNIIISFLVKALIFLVIMLFYIQRVGIFDFKIKKSTFSKLKK